MSKKIGKKNPEVFSIDARYFQVSNETKVVKEEVDCLRRIELHLKKKETKR